VGNENLERIIELFHHRWNVPALAALGSAGRRFVMLQNTLDASRDALRSSLDALVGAGFVKSNPGYGHPLRPEYVLTELGAALAHACTRYRDTAEELDVSAIAYRKWTAAVLLALREGSSGFNAIQGALGTISPRALTQALKTLAESDLVTRTVEDGYPPRPIYTLTPAGHRLAEAATAIRPQ
jgi:DNA-binding HxlR family transcriptional regulator